MPNIGLTLPTSMIRLLANINHGMTSMMTDMKLSHVGRVNIPWHGVGFLLAHHHAHPIGMTSDMHISMPPNGGFFFCVIYGHIMTEQQQREFDRAAERAREYRNTNRAYAIRYGR